MILDKIVLITASGSNIKFFSEKGYILKYGDKIEVKVEDLAVSSCIKIKVCCDFCDTVKYITNQKYLINTSNLTKPYACSSKCAYLSKNKTTNLEKYGVENPTQLKIVQEKRKTTNLEKYGTEHVLQSDIFKDKVKNTMIERYGIENSMFSEDIKDKIKQTNIERYGTEYASQSNIVKDKIKETNIERYGVEYASQSNIVKDKIKETNIERYGTEYYFQSNDRKDKRIIYDNLKALDKYNNFFLNNNDYEFIDFINSDLSLKHTLCNNIFDISRQNFNNRIFANNTLCTHCYPIAELQSIKEKEIINWIKSLNIDIIESDRIILDGKELDIYIPSYNLGIEFNGLYWHSELFKEKNYHLNKSIVCQENNVHLMHIWEDEWIFKQGIVKSIILNKLGFIKDKIYARKCEIKEVKDSKLVRKFLDDNHIQGYSTSSIQLGLYHNNELVSLMTFGKRMIKKNIEFELIRFCNKLNTNVIGASSRLFKYFVSNYDFIDLISYSDFRLFDGQMYNMLGFEKIHLSTPEYYWCKGIDRHHRSNFMKHKLVKEGYDVNKTEVEIMNERGYYRIFGSGQMKWVYKEKERLF
jgi:hypothetical protein